MFSAVWMSLALGLAVASSSAAPLSRRCTAASSGLLPTPQFRRYETADGLPSSSVYAVVQDRQGVMWFGTKGGIARYDGVSFRVFRHSADDPDSLHDNGIASLLFDQQGRLWAAGLEAGLNRYDAVHDRFLHWGHDPKDPSSLSSDKVWAIAQAADGSLWVGTVGGLDRMRPGASGFDHVANPLLGGEASAFDMISALYVDDHRPAVDRQRAGRFPAGCRRPDARGVAAGHQQTDRCLAFRRRRRRAAHRHTSTVCSWSMPTISRARCRRPVHRPAMC